jgi:hypothetical protein
MGTQFRVSSDQVERASSAISEQGVFVFDSAVAPAVVDKLYLDIKQIVSEFRVHSTPEFGEQGGIIRCACAFSESLFQFSTADFLIDFTEHCIQQKCLLKTSTIVENLPNGHVHQTWHRDFDHQNFTSSKPLGLSFILCLDDFTLENGATNFILGSHRMETMPDHELQTVKSYQAEAKKGDVIVFDSMTYHRVGANKSLRPRLGLAHCVSAAFVRQDFDYYRLTEKFHKGVIDKKRRVYLGELYKSFSSVEEYYRVKYGPIHSR